MKHLSQSRIEYLKLCKDAEQYGYTLSRKEEADWVFYVRTQKRLDKPV